jgi:peptide/nickel transport system substrate-binding protein
VRRLALLLALLVTAPAGAATRGGSVTYVSAADVGSLDPTQILYPVDIAVQLAINRALYGFVPGSLEPRPDLAAGPPEVSADQRTVTVRLRPGIRYAPPVNRAVVAGDVKYAIERSFSMVPQEYATAYFDLIEGAPHAPVPRPRRISGIETPDDLTLVFHLRRPFAAGFVAELALPTTVPVPTEVGRRYDPQGSYAPRHVAFTGPYVVASYKRGVRTVLERNPNWDPATDYRPAYLDRIELAVARVSLARWARRTVAGRGLLCCDETRRFPGVRPTATTSGLGTRFVALNVKARPFGRPLVRRAVIAALDRRRMARLSRAPLAQHLLPPGIPGHAETRTAGFDFLAHPGGSLALARRYLRRAHYHPHRHRPVVVAGARRTASAAIARSVARTLRRLRFRVRLRLISLDHLYAGYCGDAEQAAICPNMGWFAAAVDADTVLRPMFGSLHRPPFLGPANFSHFSPPRLRRALEAAAATPAGPGRSAAWARVNRTIAAAAVAAPYAWDREAVYASPDVEGQLNPFVGLWDLSFTARRS